ncbi:hypothetical protein D5018_05995 [Parashewanella curva]|uniref:Uncharacterized protein n=1 Tax=Parashewanella curva TaxID=2338552 RepID=A0A3L8PZ63_9GAMM|nr:hypothetical protein [Parashewanella curva]RLV60651.1 hypothetical protein D5018_05995 [Parashewanella curva]
MGAGVDLGAAIAVSYNAALIDRQSARVYALEAVKGFISHNKLIENGEFIVIGHEPFMIQVTKDSSLNDVLAAYFRKRPLVSDTRITLSYGGGNKEPGVLGAVVFLLKNLSGDTEWRYFEEAGEQLLTQLHKTEEYQAYAKKDESFDRKKLELLNFLSLKHN